MIAAEQVEEAEDEERKGEGRRSTDSDSYEMSIDMNSEDMDEA